MAWLIIALYFSSIILVSCGKYPPHCDNLQIRVLKYANRDIHTRSKYIFFYGQNVPNNFEYAAIFLAISDSAKYDHLSNSFSLKQGIDFDVSYMHEFNSLPTAYNKLRQFNLTKFSITLKPGKQWVDTYTLDSKLSHVLILQSLVCSDQESQAIAIGSFSNVGDNPAIASSVLSPHHLATIKRISKPLFALPPLPRASVELQQLITQATRDGILSAHTTTFDQFDSTYFVAKTSFHLLDLFPQLIVVDATKESNHTWVHLRVDHWLSRYSVLNVAWEPYSEEDPQYWILQHRGETDGLIYGIIDQLQFHHVSVDHSSFYKKHVRLSPYPVPFIFVLFLPLSLCFMI